MEKRNYAHVQALLPEIKLMLAEGKSQREVAEYDSFRDKQVVKSPLEREWRKERKLEAGSLPRPKGGREKMLRQEPLWLNRPIRSNGFAWRITCCGIFCNSQKEGETESKIPHHTSPQQRISGVRHVCFLKYPEAVATPLSIA